MKQKDLYYDSLMDKLDSSTKKNRLHGHLFTILMFLLIGLPIGIIMYELIMQMIFIPWAMAIICSVTWIIIYFILGLTDTILVYSICILEHIEVSFKKVFKHNLLNIQNLIFCLVLAIISFVVIELLIIYVK